MATYFAAPSELTKMLDTWAQDRPVYVPVSRAGHTHWSKFTPDTEISPELDGIRAVEPLKIFYFRAKECVATYPSTTEFVDDEPGFVLFGAKNCDLRGLECLDETFAKGDIKDPFWVSRREKAVVIGADCSSPAPTCFCTLLGLMPYPQSSFNVSVAVVSDGVVVEIGTDKGKNLIEAGGVELREATDEQLAERERNRQETRSQVEEQNRQYETTHSFQELVESGYESPAWNKYVGRCREDAACLAVCPTCHCFVLYDQKVGDKNERIRVWDFCYSRGYTRVGGGHSARATGNDRFKNKYVKKFQFYPAKFDMVACTGCGRCIEACLAGIDMRQVLRDVEESESA